MNFRGAYVDLKNMIHELGHIVNYYLSKKNLPFIYEDSTIFVGETASIVNEILLNRYLYENAKTEEERIFYLSKEIENYFTSVFKQTMYTEFENDLYNLKLSKELSSEVLSERYGQLIRKYYGKNIVYDEQSNIEWTRLGHLFRWSYYPYKYATGLIIASVVVNSLLNENTLSKKQYIKFLSSGSSMYSLELLKMLNIDLTNPSIIENGFKVMENDVEKLNKVLSIKK
jgi:oligoendopeptidase F